jgi:tight adherence protein C
MSLFLGAKLILMFAPVALGLLAVALGLLPPLYGVLGGIYAGGMGLIGPSLWLDAQKRSRQAVFRRSLPDALDLLVICVEGGLTLGAALARIAEALRAVHPSLATELDIVRREMQLGRTAGEALRSMGERTDLEEVRGLASVIVQAERLGAGLAKSLRVHAETLRLRRQQRAEERAQKAATKVLIPTLFFIFPAIFVVVLGPAMIQLSRTLASRP